MDQQMYCYTHGQFTQMPHDSAETWTLCLHLQPIAEAILKRGASIVGLSSAWTRTLLAVTLDRGPSIAAATRLVAAIPQVIVWENNDSHYAIEYGLQCTECRHSLAWPQSATDAGGE